ncbi:hypothetical protein [Halosegnis marinus]|uniref:hypothetical protein n=1 Tax=Halosegnis marinus TaxID=3034023 RepID=UPI00361E2C55
MRRALALCVLLVLAGCGATSDGGTATDTVTAVEVPDDATLRRDSRSRASSDPTRWPTPTPECSRTPPTGSSRPKPSGTRTGRSGSR